MHNNAAGTNAFCPHRNVLALVLTGYLRLSNRLYDKVAQTMPNMPLADFFEIEMIGQKTFFGEELNWCEKRRILQR